MCTCLEGEVKRLEVEKEEEEDEEEEEDDAGGDGDDDGNHRSNSNYPQRKRTSCSNKSLSPRGALPSFAVQIHRVISLTRCMPHS